MQCLILTPIPGLQPASQAGFLAARRATPAHLSYPNRRRTCMQLGMIGLGRMGANMVRRLMRGGHQCVVWDQNHANVEKLAGEGATGGSTLDDLLKTLQAARAGWLVGSPPAPGGPAA